MSDHDTHDAMPGTTGSGTSTPGTSTPGSTDGGTTSAGAADPDHEAAPGQADRTLREEFRVSGEAVVSKVREIVREGNVRRIAIKNDEGRTLLEIPLTIGVIGTVLLPVWAALGAMAALVANLTIAVERVAPKADDEPQPPTA